MRRTWARFALALWAGAVVIVATSRGFAVTHRVVFGFFRRTLDLDPAAAEAWTTVVRKAFHVPAYALLTALAWWALPPARRRPGLVLLLALAVAVLDEGLQSAYPGRTGRVTDVLVDLIGILLGLALVQAFRRPPPDRPA